MKAVISQLWVYPIKGCAGQPFKQVQALLTGLHNDRRLMVVDAVTGRFVTQRSDPKMVLIQPSIDNEVLTVSMQGQGVAHFNLATPHTSKRVTVWQDTLPANDLGDAAAAWFTQALGRAVRLVCFDAQHQRMCHSAAHGIAPASHLFADGYPYLVLSEASLDALNLRLQAAGSTAIAMDRFRPNIVLANVDEHTEDYASTLVHASGAVFHMVSACTRCSVPTVDPKTGLLSTQGQPTLALAQYRYDSQQDGVTFGMNAQISHAALLTVGDSLDVNLGF